MTTGPTSAASDTGRSAALLMLVQATILMILAGILVLDVVRGKADGTTQALTEAGLVLVFVAAALALARGLVGGSGWARTPSVVWNVLLLPVAFSMFGAGQALVGTFVLVMAVLTLVMVWRTPPLDISED